MQESASWLPPWIKAIEAALTANPALETWAGHFHHRLPEFEELLQHWPRKRVRAALELGCGNGLAAVFFSPLADKIVASDLPTTDHQAHSIGLEFAKSFIQQMKIDHAEVLGCSAEKIPVPDRSFDLVYGIYCLEHIPDREAALRETKRVLEKGGEAIFTVPGAAWALFYPFGFYKELLQRIVGRVKKKLCRAPATAAPSLETDSASPKVTDASSFFRHYPHFPFPEPHGAHVSWPSELRYYRLSHWEELLRGCGFGEISAEPIAFLPKWVKIFLPEGWQTKLEERLKNSRRLRPFAQFYCLRARVS